MLWLKEIGTIEMDSDMIVETKGNLLEAEAEALVNTVNIVGVMGKGIALQFKRAFPENYAVYERQCKEGKVKPGSVLVVENRALAGPRFIINFPTKRHWRGSARLEDIESGLLSLVEEVKRRKIGSIAVPPLGCGNGGLHWEDVRPRIVSAFVQLPHVRVLLYPPGDTPTAETMAIRTQRPKMTPAAAALIGILGRYARFDYRLSLLEIHKLAYFLKIAGEPLQRTHFEKQLYGPYADNLRHVLNRLEGHFLSGFGDGSRNRPDTQIRLLPDAEAEAADFLRNQPYTLERFARVAKLIDGFETPYGLELLSSAHWVATQENQDTEAKVVSAVRSWSPRKASLFSERHIVLAWRRLRATCWI
jgi:O-acetyl-ADP-ribose deacetylase (regulator of RNase III)